tara:strand:+ start:2496 stop:2615 length:120 start_codon:yes stop_codon:yes gene_type:complete
MLWEVETDPKPGQGTFIGLKPWIGGRNRPRVHCGVGMTE